MHHFQRWRSVIVLATTRADVDRIMREYVACLLPSDLSKLPQSSQLAVSEASTDLAGSAVTLRRDELRFDGEDDAVALIREITQMFTAAAARVAHLDGRGTVIEDIITDG